MPTPPKAISARAARAAKRSVITTAVANAAAAEQSRLTRERRAAAEEESKAGQAALDEVIRRKKKYISERRILNWAIIIRLSKNRDGSYKTLDRDDKREIDNDSRWRWLVDSFGSITFSEYAMKNKSEQMEKAGKSHEETYTAGYLEYFRVLYRITDDEDSAAERIAFSEETTPELRKRDKLLEINTLPKMKAEGGYTRRTKGKKRGTRKIRR